MAPPNGKPFNNFQKVVGAIFHLIKTHHKSEQILRARVDPQSPDFIQRIHTWLSTAIQPALPTEHTLLLLQTNNANWKNAAQRILEDHYADTALELKNALHTLSLEDWSEALQVALCRAQRRFPHLLPVAIHQTAQDLHTLGITENVDIPPVPTRRRKPRPRHRHKRLTPQQNKRFLMQKYS